MPENKDDVIAFGMSRQQVIDAINASNQEFDKNYEESNNYSKYAQTMKKGREALKTQAGYYPYLPKGV